MSQFVILDASYYDERGDGFSTENGPDVRFVRTNLHPDPSSFCSHSSGRTYDDRFGHTVCSECHIDLAWRSRAVRDGVYGPGTFQWAMDVAEGLKVNPNYAPGSWNASEEDPEILDARNNHGQGF